MTDRHAPASPPKRVLFLAAAASLTAVSGLPLTSAAADTIPPPVVRPCHLGNGGFEIPGPLIGPGHLRNDVLPWKTTTPGGVIEVWGPGNAGANGGLEVPAAAGKQFAELNSTGPSTIYQDLATVPGTYLVWRLRHRARTTSATPKDVIRVRVGPPGNATLQVPLGQVAPFISDGGTSWGTRIGLYHVPAGQHTTRFAIDSVSSVGGPSYGNFVDAVSISCTRLPILPAPPHPPAPATGHPPIPPLPTLPPGPPTPPGPPRPPVPPGIPRPAAVVNPAGIGQG